MRENPYQAPQESRKKSDWPVIADILLAAPLVALVLYVVGYFVLSEYHDDYSVNTRIFPSRAVREIYVPVGRVEGFLTGHEVYLVFPLDEE